MKKVNSAKIVEIISWLDSNINRFSDPVLQIEVRSILFELENILESEQNET